MIEVIEESVEVRSRALVPASSWSGAIRTEGRLGEMERLLSEVLVVSDLLVVDVSEADFVDSSFLHNVLVADRRAKEQDKVFRVQMNTVPIVRRAFEVSGVLGHLTVVRTREKALA